jgi:hypothetical protein
VVIFISLLAYIVCTYLEYKNKTSTKLNNNTNIQNTSTSTPNTSSTSSQSIDPYEGWKTYICNELGIKFKYNDKFSDIRFFPGDEINEINLVVGYGGNPNISFKDIRGINTSSQEYQDKLFPATYLNTENPEKKVTIGDTEYTFKDYVFGEGVPNETYPNCMESYGSDYYYIEVNNKITVTIEASTAETCIGENEKESSTYNESDFEEALEIISSIEFI